MSVFVLRWLPRSKPLTFVGTRILVKTALSGYNRSRDKALLLLSAFDKVAADHISLTSMFLLKSEYPSCDGSFILALLGLMVPQLVSTPGGVFSVASSNNMLANASLFIF